MSAPKDSLVDLLAFRKANGLRQADLADILGVSISYISLVEKGTSTLSRKYIDKIDAVAKDEMWDTSPLIPASYRWSAAFNYCAEAHPEFDYDILNLLFDIPDPISEKVNYGEMPIPLTLIDRVCSKFLELNREWLISGTGEMLLEHKTIEATKLDILLRKVDSLEKVNSSLKQDLNDIKSMLSSLCKSLPPHKTPSE